MTTTTAWIDPFGLYRKKFFRRYGSTKSDPKYQIHHMIPKELYGKSVNAVNFAKTTKILKCHGIEMNSLDNLIGLPKNSNDNPRGNQAGFGRSQHNSNHDDYSEAVNDSILRIAKKPCATQKAELQRLQVALRTGLRQGEPIMNAHKASKSNWDLYLIGKGL